MTPIASLRIASTLTIRFVFWTLSLVFACLSQSNLHAEEQESPEAAFGRIAEILSRQCLSCHGPKSKEGNYSVESIAELFRSGDSAIKPIVQGNAAESELYKRLISADENIRMPFEAPPLKTDEIKQIETWIRRGAKTPPQTNVPLNQFISRQTATPSAAAHYPHRYPVSAIALSPDGKLLYSSGYGEVLVWSTTSSELIERITNMPRFITDIEASADGQWLAVAGGKPGLDGTVTLVPLNDRSSVRQLLHVADTPTDMTMSPNSTLLAIGDAWGNIRIYDLKTSILSSQWTPHADAILAIEWSNDGKRIATASRDRTGKLFDVDSNSLIASYSRHERAVGGVTITAFGPVTYDDSGVLHLWNPDKDEQRAERAGLPRVLQRLAQWESQVFVPSQGSLLRFELEKRESDQGKDDKGNEKKKTSWRLNPLPPLELNSSQWITSMATSGTERIAAAGTDQGMAAIWDLSTGKLVQSFDLKP